MRQKRDADARGKRALEALRDEPGRQRVPLPLGRAAASAGTRNIRGRTKAQRNARPARRRTRPAVDRKPPPLRPAPPRAANHARPTVGNAHAALVHRLRRDPHRLGQHRDPVRAAFSRLGGHRRTDLATPGRPAGRRSSFGHVALDLVNIKHGIPQDQRLRPPTDGRRAARPDDAPGKSGDGPHRRRGGPPAGGRHAAGHRCSACSRRCRPARCGSRSSTRSAWARTSARSCTWPTIDEQLVASRIWTDSEHIEEQLTGSPTHMETVIQKYLRNEFATIDEYNAQAGEVAEPYRVLVVANFPANFTEAAARKLLSIVDQRAAVRRLHAVERRPQAAAADRFSPRRPDGRRRAPRLGRPKERRFRWRYPAFEQLPLALDRPPPAERFNDVVRAAGARGQGRDARRGAVRDGRAEPDGSVVDRRQQPASSTCRSAGPGR